MNISTFACLALLLHGGLGVPSIEPSLRKALQGGGTANVLVTMRDSTSSVLEGFKGRNFATRGDRITTMATELQELAAASQAKVITFLEEELSRTGGGCCSYRSFWISNQIFIRRASLELVENLQAFNEIESIAEEQTLKMGRSVRTSGVRPCPREAKHFPWLSWSIYQIRAQEVWETEGNNGTGIVVGTIGTGVRASHEALRSNFRRDYGWLDYYDHSPEPSDDVGHGTEVTGPIVGAFGVGVAPGSEWIACKACGDSGCGEEAFIGCGQWMMCPTDPHGQHPNCSTAPQVVSNSWGFRRSGKGYRSVTNALHMAGIISIFEAGNNRENGCSSLSSPADYEDVIAVGSTDWQPILSDFSSLGPSLVTSEFKPDVVAPGECILSPGFESDNEYSQPSGTDMATPHVAGTVALMLASRPADQPCFEKIRNALRQSSEQVPSQDNMFCNGVGDHERPNYHHGYGFVNALRAVQIYKNMTSLCP